jgi:hypothetical protein
MAFLGLEPDLDVLCVILGAERRYYRIWGAERRLLPRVSVKIQAHE